ncbi:MAG: flagellar biosynthesis protein FlgB [Alteromonadaceae bacterium]|nr:MAG: flagellar biosynthesis protein FlgB [Alteromonadaceae bacterium]
MIVNDINLSLATWALGLEQAKANVAANNIANANVSGSIREVRFEQLLSDVAKAVQSGDNTGAMSLFKQEIVSHETTGTTLFNGVALDNEVAELSAAQGRYRVIAEALSRQFGLMSLATRGR